MDAGKKTPKRDLIISEPKQLRSVTFSYIVCGRILVVRCERYHYKDVYVARMFNEELDYRDVTIEMFLNSPFRPYEAVLTESALKKMVWDRFRLSSTPPTPELYADVQGNITDVLDIQNPDNLVYGYYYNYRWRPMWHSNVYGESLERFKLTDPVYVKKKQHEAFKEESERQRRINERIESDKRIAEAMKRREEEERKKRIFNHVFRKQLEEDEWIREQKAKKQRQEAYKRKKAAERERKRLAVLTKAQIKAERAAKLKATRAQMKKDYIEYLRKEAIKKREYIRKHNERVSRNRGECRTSTIGGLDLYHQQDIEAGYYSKVNCKAYEDRLEVLLSNDIPAAWALHTEYEDPFVPEEVWYKENWPYVQLADWYSQVKYSKEPKFRMFRLFHRMAKWNRERWKSMC